MLPRDHAPPPSTSRFGRAITGLAGRQATYFSSTRSDPLSRQGTCLRGKLSTLIALVLAAVFALPASAARADLINLATCNTSVLSQPFAPWGDVAFYELSPGGDFEQPSWTLNGAQRGPWSEPYAATGKVGNWSLTLPAGSWAQSPLTCVDTAYPTVRFFIAGTGSVAVSLVYGNAEIPAGMAIAGSTWFPTPVMVTTSAVVAAASGGVAQVSLRLAGVSGDPQVDDVFIDPWNRG
jgi:hypothetical protein